MRHELTCSLNDIGVQDLNDRIYVEDIKEEPKVSMETAKRPGYGLFPMTKPKRDELTIKVTLYVKDRNRLRRQDIFDKVMGWCGDGWFRRNTRPDQRIYVYCTKYPSTETFSLTGRLEIEFTAYGEAFWQDIAPMTVASSSAVSSATHEIIPKCTQDCFLEAEISPSSGILDTVIIYVGSQTLRLLGMSVTAASPLKIYYDEMHILRIMSGTTSLLSNRSEESADDIILTAGKTNTVSMIFNTACSYTLSVRGLWK